MIPFSKGFKGTRFILTIIPIFSVFAIFANIHHLKKYSLSNNDRHHKPSTLGSNCDSIFKYGRYLSDIDEEPRHWQPDGCALQHYQNLNDYGIGSCLRPGDEIMIVGDSTARQVYWGFLNILFRMHHQFNGPHRDDITQRDSITVRLVWDTFFNTTASEVLSDVSLNGVISRHRQEAIQFKKDSKYNPKLYLFITGGAWFPFLEAPDLVVPRFTQNFKRLLDIVDNRADGAFDGVYVAPPFIPFYGILQDVRMENMNNNIYSGMMLESDALFNYVRTNQTVQKSYPAKYNGGVRYRTREGRQHEISSYYVPVFNELSGTNHRGLFDQMGIHFLEPSFVEQANILLNHFCNQRVADELKQPLSGTCCVKFKDYKYGENGWFIRLILKSLVFIPLCALMKTSSNVKKLIPTAKFSALVILVLGSISTWAGISNQSQLISKISLVYSSQEFFGLIQVWILLSLLSYVFFPTEDNKPGYAQGLLSKQLILEWQGICVSLLILIQYSGFSYLKKTFDGEMCVRLLSSTWAMLELYQFTLEYLDSLSINFTLIKSYKSSFPLFAYRISRISILPLLLSSSINYSVMENIPATVAPSYIPLAIKLAYWFTFVFLVFPLVFHLSSTLSSTDIEASNRHLEMQTLIFIFFSLIPFIFSPFLMYLADSNSKHIFLTTLNSFAEDYWVVLFAVWVAFYCKLQSMENSKSKFQPSLRLVSVAVIIFVLLLNGFRYLFSYFISISPNGPVAPTSFIELHNEVQDKLLEERGKGYNSIAHTVLVLGFAVCYLILRLRFLNTTIEAASRYIGLWVRAAKSGYEALLLYPYVLLAASGTLRLNYIPTGIVLSSQISHTFFFTPIDYVFSYTGITLMGKLNKCVALFISFGTFCTLVEISSSVWKKEFSKTVAVSNTEMIKEENELQEQRNLITN
ncbi:uncharacterized protein SAPINGB_P002518 [Magnusiomyces paraingens]|uniref:Cas1p 10 TM acyl transferase domain-containing protein n=1 Tax=Magnusiomyces paraingens TaxID=2606893 RepID=A0A5E8BEB8_9ASCO|nr:uncharacterized protein SAPINGB_P002518 [Saprochaete ingens]VVT49935.1 unnamed protein product [Saprochaete ingens]